MGVELLVAFLSGLVVGLAFALRIVAARVRLFRVLFWGAVLVVMAGGWLVWSGTLGSAPERGVPTGFDGSARPR